MRKLFKLDNVIEILEIALEKGYIGAIPEKELTQAKLLETYDREEFELDKEDTDELFYRNSIDETVGGFPPPPDIEGEIPKMPLDITELTDKQLMYLHGAFTAMAARTGWLYALADAGERACSLLVEQYEQDYMESADRKDFGGKAKSHAILKAEAQKHFPQIKKWKHRRNKHAIDASKLKKMLEQFDKNCDRLSRQWTFRVEEREHS